MKEQKYNCPNYQIYINADHQLEKECHKHYCLCDDEFKWCKETNNKYQKAKKDNRAGNGKFFK